MWYSGENASTITSVIVTTPTTAMLHSLNHHLSITQHLLTHRQTADTVWWSRPTLCVMVSRPTLCDGVSADTVWRSQLTLCVMVYAWTCTATCTGQCMTYSSMLYERLCIVARATHWQFLHNIWFVWLRLRLLHLVTSVMQRAQYANTCLSVCLSVCSRAPTLSSDIDLRQLYHSKLFNWHMTLTFHYES